MYYFYFFFFFLHFFLNLGRGLSFDGFKGSSCEENSYEHVKEWAGTMDGKITMYVDYPQKKLYVHIENKGVVFWSFAQLLDENIYFGISSGAKNETYHTKNCYIISRHAFEDEYTKFELLNKNQLK